MSDIWIQGGKYVHSVWIKCELIDLFEENVYGLPQHINTDLKGVARYLEALPSNTTFGGVYTGKLKYILFMCSNLWKWTDIQQTSVNVWDSTVFFFPCLMMCRILLCWWWYYSFYGVFHPPLFIYFSTALKS